MKKLFAFLLSVLLICGIVTPAFAEDADPNEPELISAEIVSIPEKNKVVYTGGAPEAPDGIVVKLTFSDGSEITDTVIKEDNGGFWVAGIPVLDLEMRPGINYYGEQEATLYFGSESVSASYNYYSEEPEDQPIGPFCRALNCVKSFFRKIRVSLRRLVFEILSF